jgi:hypothetical protein
MDPKTVKKVEDSGDAGNAVKKANDQAISDLIDKSLKKTINDSLDRLMTPMNKVKERYEKIVIYHFIAIPEPVYEESIGDNTTATEIKGAMEEFFHSESLQDIAVKVIETADLSDEIAGYFVLESTRSLKYYKRIVKQILSKKTFPPADALELIGLYFMHGKSAFTVPINRQSGLHSYIEPNQACLGMLIEMIFSTPSINSKQFFYNMGLFTDTNKAIAEINKNELTNILTLAQFRGKGSKNIKMRNMKGDYSVLSNTKSDGPVEDDAFTSRMFFLHFRQIKASDIEKGIYGLYLPKGGDEVIDMPLPTLLAVGMQKREIFSFCGLRIFRAAKHYDKDIKIKATRARQDATNEFAAIKRVTEGTSSSRADYTHSEKTWKAHLQKNSISTDAPDLFALEKQKNTFKEYKTPNDLLSSDPSFVKHVLEEDWKINSFQDKINYLDRIYNSNSNYISKAISDFGLDGVLVARVISHVKTRKWELVMAIIKAHIVTTSDVLYFNVFESNTKAKALLFWPEDGIWEYDNRIIKADDEELLYSLIAFYPFYINGEAMKYLNMDKVHSITRSLGNEVSVEVMASFSEAKKEIIAAKIKGANDRRALKRNNKK